MNKEPEEELRPEYDFRAGVRGKYAEQFAAGTNLVLLDVDIARAFPNAAAVNRALRTYLREHSANAE